MLKKSLFFLYSVVLFSCTSNTSNEESLNSNKDTLALSQPVVSKEEEELPSVSKIDTTNFFKSFGAYALNGNVYDMISFYDTAYFARCTGTDKDTVRCMNEQYCGEAIKGFEGETQGCIEFNEIEKIEFLNTNYTNDKREITLKVNSFDGRTVKCVWKYILIQKKGKFTFSLVGM